MSGVDDHLDSVADGESEPADQGYRGPQVCKIIGITYRQLDYWARTDLVRPSIADAQGSGTQRRYSYRDLVTLKVIKSLLDAGLSLQAVRNVIDYLRRELKEELASANLVLDGSTPVLVHDDGEIVDLLRRGQGVLNILPLGGIVEQLEAAITALPGPADAHDDAGHDHRQRSSPPQRRTGS